MVSPFLGITPAGSLSIAEQINGWGVGVIEMVGVGVVVRVVVGVGVKVGIQKLNSQGGVGVGVIS